MYYIAEIAERHRSADGPAFRRPSHASAAAAHPAGGGDPARRRRDRLPDRLELRARLPRRRQRGRASASARSAASTSAPPDARAAATWPTRATTRGSTTGSSASCGRAFPARSRSCCRPRAKCRRRLQHPKRSTVGVRVPDHPVVAALLAELARADPVVDADPAGRRCAAQRSGSDPRAVASSASTSSIDAGPCPAVPTTVVDLAARAGRDRAAAARGDPARLGLALTGIAPARRAPRGRDEVECVANGVFARDRSCSGLCRWSSRSRCTKPPTAIVARMFGDQTAWMLGRVTLNPLKHIDLGRHDAGARRAVRWSRRPSCSAGRSRCRSTSATCAIRSAT